MKKLFPTLMIIAMIIFGSANCMAAQPHKKRAAKSKATATMTPKKLIDLIESKESAKITDINSLASEIDRAHSITTEGLDRLIAAKYPTFKNKSLGEKLAQGRKAIENYIYNNKDYNTNYGMAAGAYALCAFSDYSSLATMGELLEKMPTLEARQKFLEFGVQLSIFQNNASNLTYYHGGFDIGFGSHLMSLFSASSIDDMNIGIRKMLQADLKALATGAITSSANPYVIFQKFIEKNSESTLDAEMFSELKDTFEDDYRNYKSVSKNIDADYARLSQAHSAWLETLPKEKAEAMANSLAILMEACLNIEL